MELERPMLAAPTKPGDLRVMKFPKLGSRKLDGVRALCRHNPETGRPELVSRTLKLIPNLHTQRLYAREEFIGLDGELGVGNPNDKHLMQQTTSGCMSVSGTPNVVWYIFDKWNSDESYVRRASAAKLVCTNNALSGVVWLSQTPIHTYEELEIYEEDSVTQGYEGVILRDPFGPYKQNRSTLKQGYMLKVKRFDDSEAVVIGWKEQQRNDNEATTDARGYTKRSSHAAGKTDAGVLGALEVRDCKTGVEFDIGTGFTAEQRYNLWQGRQYLKGKIVKYKSFAIGVKDKPRFPVFVSFRDRRDM